MKDEIKAEIKALQYCICGLKQVQKAKDARERLAAVKLEVEFSDRIGRLQAADREPGLPFQPGEPIEVNTGGVR